VEVQDETGGRLGQAGLAERVDGIARLHALIAKHLGEDCKPDQVAVGIETVRGPRVSALAAAGYVYSSNDRTDPYHLHALGRHRRHLSVPR